MMKNKDSQTFKMFNKLKWQQLKIQTMFLKLNQMQMQVLPSIILFVGTDSFAWPLSPHISTCKAGTIPQVIQSQKGLTNGKTLFSNEKWLCKHKP